jgi:hypothetical protein
MSVAVGLGDMRMMLLCADRQMTDAQAGLKFEGRKVRGYASTGLEKPHNIAFAYCGNPEIADTLFDSLIEGVSSAMEDASDCDVFEAEYFRQCLLPVFRSKDAKGMMTLIALQTAHRCFLFKTKADQVVIGDRECIGGGDSSVLRYIADMASRTEMHSVETALPFAIYLVSLANRYVDGCGFGVDAVILQDGKPITFVGKEQTGKYSKRFAQFERKMEKQFFMEQLNES